MSRAVILLKSPPYDLAEDAYFQQLSSSGYNPHFVEVIRSVFINEKLLADIIHVGPDGFKGVVMTSNRAAEAWINALKSIDMPGDWLQIPFYVVGEATGRTLRNMRASHPDHISEELIIGAAHSGTSESLATFVLDDLIGRSGSGKLLYLTGDKNTDTFNRMMSEGGVDIKSLCVYETMAPQELGESINRVVKHIQKDSFPTWIVFFAPSSSDFALPHLGRYFRLSGLGTGMNTKLAAIGPTTANFLRTERRLTVDAVASKPIPDQLVQAICDADRESP